MFYQQQKHLLTSQDLTELITDIDQIIQIVIYTIKKQFYIQLKAFILNILPEQALASIIK